MPEEHFPDQRSTQDPNQGEDRKEDSDDREVSAYSYSPPGSPDEQQHASPNSKSMSTSDLNLNPSHMQYDEIVQVTFVSYEVKAKNTTRLADIPLHLQHLVKRG